MASTWNRTKEFCSIWLFSHWYIFANCFIWVRLWWSGYLVTWFFLSTGSKTKWCDSHTSMIQPICILKNWVTIGLGDGPHLATIHCLLYSTKLKRGYTGFTLSVCEQNGVCSVFLTILVRSILYLHILLCNFQRCVACNVYAQFKFFFSKLFKFGTLILSSFDFRSNMTQ